MAARAGEFKFRNLKIRGLIPIQPYFGGEERTASETQLVGVPVVSVERADWCWKAFLPEGSDRDHPAANLFGPKSGDMSGVKIPKCLVFIGGFDPLKDWQKKYCEGMKKNGKKLKMIEYPKAIHSFYMVPELPESRLFINEFRNFIYFG